MRTGIGYDIHRLSPTLDPSTIPIGGVAIPCLFRVQAHSDGDVLLHAIADACLGALALGDLGTWFPDSDPNNYNRPSLDFIKRIKEEMFRLGWSVHQIDSVVLLEAPKLSPHSLTIRQNIALQFGIELSSVSVKAKTGEGLGPIGEQQALAAYAVITLEPLHGA